MSDDRTEPATPKRRREARKKGQVARSAELPMAVSLGLAVALAPTVVRKLAGTLQVEWPLAISQASRATPQAALALFGRISREALFALMPLVAGIAAASVIAQLALVGAQPNLHNLVPKLNRLDPRQGLKRLVSKQALWELGRNLAKLALLALVVYGTWRSGLERLMAGSGSLDSFLATLGAVVSDLLHRAALVAALIGVVDAVVAKRRHRRVIRMTKQEVKEESKQSEGNPQVKSAIRGKQMRMSRMRMMAEVAKADVVLTNPTHLAVGLKYEEGAQAPVVLAKGAGEVAERIKAEAARNGVPVVENKPLARALYQGVDIGEQIPVALYRAVAEVLAVVYRTRRAA